jgi:hypothetical protein
VAESSRLCATTAAVVFRHTLCLPIVPFVTKARKRSGNSCEDVRSVIWTTMQSSVALRQIVTLSVSLLSARRCFPDAHEYQFRQTVGKYFEFSVLLEQLQVMLPTPVVGDNIKY